MRAKAIIAYDGSHFFGFQKQKSTKQTVASFFEEALRSLQIHSPVAGSGRTDAGVHASGQVIHFDLPPFWSDMTKLKYALNRKLSHIQVKHVSLVNEDFHARFSAKKREYRYVFKTQMPSVFEQPYIAHYDDFDSLLLQEALTCFEGIHDFSLFCKTGTLTHTNIREVYRATYKRHKQYHFIYFQANGFLRSQVRMMVESAMAYTRKEISLMQIQEQLQGKEKHHSRLAPAGGLYLARIFY